jgi:hypothetical protein
MELLCPNCQKKLTVPDQYAGQLMKCPLCNGTFTTPSLAAGPTAAFAPPPMPPAPQPVVTPPAPKASDPEVLPLESDFPPPPAGNEPMEVQPLPPLAPEVMVHALVTGDYQNRWSLWFSPRVLPWVAVGALVLVFVLSFFSWFGFYPGGLTIVSQNAWQAAFGSYSVPADWESLAPVGKATKATEAKEGAEADAATVPGLFLKERVEPGASALLILFLLILLLTVLLAGAAAALEVITMPLPPWLGQLKPWRWALVSAATLLTFLFLLLQLLAGSNLASRVRERADSEYAGQVKQASAATEKKELEVKHATTVASLRRTGALSLACWLSFVALVSAVLTFWLGRRTMLPMPRVDVLW